MGFSAMPAEDYILIIPFAYRLEPGLNDHRISAQQQATERYRQPLDDSNKIK